MKRETLATVDQLCASCERPDSSGKYWRPKEQDVIGVLELLKKNDYVVYDAGRDGWYLPRWNRDKGQRLINNLKSEEGRGLVYWASRYTTEMGVNEKVMGDYFGDGIYCFFPRYSEKV